MDSGEGRCSIKQCSIISSMPELSPVYTWANKGALLTQMEAETKEGFFEDACLC